MASSKWITRLHKKYKDVPKPDIRKTKQYSICKYTLVVGKQIYQLSFYSKDNFKTVNIMELYDAKHKKGKIFVVNKAISEKFFDRLYNETKNGKFSFEKIILTIKSLRLSEAFSVKGLFKKLFKDFSWANMSHVLYSIFLLVVLISFFANVIRNFISRKMVDKTEDEVNKELFAGQTGKEPEFNVYSGLIYNIQVILETKSINGLLVLGPPGTGKTYIVRRTLYFSKIPFKVLKGTTLDTWNVYAQLYHNRNKVLVLDDFDIKWDEGLIAIIKAATDTNPKRTVYFPVTSIYTKGNEGQTTEIPQSFTYSGKLIILANKDKKDIPAPILSRMPTFVVDFNINKMLKVLRSMLKYIRKDVSMETKEEVINFISYLVAKKKIKRVDFRTIEIAIDLRLTYPDKWKSIVLSFI